MKRRKWPLVLQGVGVALMLVAAIGGGLWWPFIIVALLLAVKEILFYQARKKL